MTMQVTVQFALSTLKSKLIKLKPKASFIN